MPASTILQLDNLVGLTTDSKDTKLTLSSEMSQLAVLEKRTKDTCRSSKSQKNKIIDLGQGTEEVKDLLASHQESVVTVKRARKRRRAGFFPSERVKSPPLLSMFRR